MEQHYPNIIGRQFIARRQAQAVQSILGGGIRADPRDRHLANVRTDVDNNAATLRFHHRYGRLHGVERPKYIKLDNLMVEIGRNVSDLADHGLPGIIYQDVNAAKARVSFVNQGFHLGRVGHIGRDDQRFGVGWQPLSNRFQFVGRTRRQYQFGPGLGKDAGRGLTNTHRSAGNYYYFIVYFHFLYHSLNSFEWYDFGSVMSQCFIKILFDIGIVQLSPLIAICTVIIRAAGLLRKNKKVTMA
jgi:hypothetical protein